MTKQKGFIQIPLLIGIIVAVAITSVGGYGGLEYYKTSKVINEAEQLAGEERYDEAIGKLEIAQNNLVVKNLGLKRQEINNEIETNKRNLEDKSKFTQALEKIDEGNYQEAIDLFSEISEGSFYSNNAKLKIEEAKRKMVEEELGETKIAQKEAEKKAQQEVIKRSQEEVARKEAERREETERLAKEQQERETETQRQRAEQEKLAKEQQEREKVLELARTNPLIKGAISGEIKFYINPIPAYAASDVSKTVDMISKTFSGAWDLGEPINARRVYNPSDADIEITWVKNYGGEVLGETIFQSYIKVGLGAENCLGEWRAFDSITVATILWHELGHAMGYGHSTNPNNVMYPTLDIHFEVDHEVSEVIAGGWYLPIPFCGGGTYWYSFETASAYSGFDIYVLPPGQSAYQTSGGSGNYYPNCSAEGMSRYSNSCTVPNGAQIYIGNTSFQDAIRLSGEIINTDLPPIPDLTWDTRAFRFDMNKLQEYRELFHSQQ